MRVLASGSLAILVVALAACSGGTTPDGAGATTAAAAPATEPAVSAPSMDTAPAEEPSQPAGGASIAPATPGAAGGGSGDGFATRPCDLVSPADAEAAAGVGGLTSQVLQVDSTSGICSYRDAANQVEVYAGVWDREAATQQWTTMEYLVDAGTPDMERVNDLGGDAIFSTAGAVLLVHKGDTLVQLTVRNPALDEAATKAAVLALGRAVLAHM
jgi:hypothetical protein